MWKKVPRKESLKECISLNQQKKSAKLKVQLLGSGSILREVIAAAKLLEDDFNVSSTIWSVTSFTLLAREGYDVARSNMLNPKSKPKIAYVTSALDAESGPVIAATDYVRNYSAQITSFVPKRYCILGTDGFGRSDSRKNLRSFFEVDRYYIAIAALKTLSDEGSVSAKLVDDAISKYGISKGKKNPITL